MEGTKENIHRKRCGSKKWENSYILKKGIKWRMTEKA